MFSSSGCRTLTDIKPTLLESLNRMEMDVLPSEILYTIVSYIPRPERFLLERVCSVWQAAVTGSCKTVGILDMDKLCKADFDKETDVKITRATAALTSIVIVKGKTIEGLRFGQFLPSFDNVIQMLDIVLQKHDNQFKKLQFIPPPKMHTYQDTIYSSIDRFGELIEKLVQFAPNLQEFTITPTKALARRFCLVDLSGFDRLEQFCCGGVFPVNLNSLKLKGFQIWSSLVPACDGIGPRAIDNTLLQTMCLNRVVIGPQPGPWTMSLPNMRELILNECEFTCAIDLGTGRYLEVIDINDCRSLSFQGIDFRHWTKLSTLKYHTWRDPHPGFDLTRLPELIGHGAIKELSVSCRYSHTVEFFPDVMEACLKIAQHGSLNLLNLYSSSELSEEGKVATLSFLPKLVKASTGLHTLGLSSLELDPDSVFQVIRDAGQELKCVKFGLGTEYGNFVENLYESLQKEKPPLLSRRHSELCLRTKHFQSSMRVNQVNAKLEELYNVRLDYELDFVL